MRDLIIAEIQRVAASNGGKPPGRRVFERETGIRPASWIGVYWARWGDALLEAGFAPNQKQGRSDSDFLVERLIDAVRHFGRIPTYSELRLFARSVPDFPSHSTLSNRFSGKPGMVAALREWTASREGYDDIAALLPASEAAAERATIASFSKVSEGYVYLIKSGAFYKIGRSEDAERRFKQITIALPDKAVLFHTIRTDDPAGIEAYWHRRFAERRANGEWFKLTPQDVAAFRKRKFQ